MRRGDARPWSSLELRRNRVALSALVDHGDEYCTAADGCSTRPSRCWAPARLLPHAAAGGLDLIISAPVTPSTRALVVIDPTIRQVPVIPRRFAVS